MLAPILWRWRQTQMQAATQVLPQSFFISHDFLSSLEESGSARQRTGWQPMHLLVENAGGELLGAAPCYVKSHSQGEYVFDHGWADAYRARRRPLLSEAPGGRAVHAGDRPPPPRAAGPQARRGSRGAGCGALAEVCRRTKASSVHVTFRRRPSGTCSASTAICTAPTSNSIGRTPATRLRRFPRRAGLAQAQDHPARARATRWHNGITIHWLTGADLTESVWDAFFDFYMETGSRKWGRPYLTREFYSLRRRRTWPTVSCW